MAKPTFSPEEQAQIEAICQRYPTRQSAVMPVLWLAQEKFGELSPPVLELVAETLGLPLAHVTGVVSFYTMYLPQRKGKWLLELCTCFTCGECGGRELWAYIQTHLELNAEGVTPDGLFWFREAECLGACDTPPVLQIEGRRMVFSLTPEKLEKVLESLRQGVLPPFESVPPRNPEWT
ncbi:MAG: NAD(P)H-dependent oxidoreductase subunit E [Bacteroidia bacterium]|nr:NAD(P)H-dependent oxidoreductase subunit E [Bacteroidia bacterium]MDW8089693.1 NAD(P)H-dependent oxidoreductase subunit E [Bacteroidia bacterium]